MNVDLPLAVLAAVLNLPTGASETLFIVARTAGWIAHALEQYRTCPQSRPRPPPPRMRHARRPTADAVRLPRRLAAAPVST